MTSIAVGVAAYSAGATMAVAIGAGLGYFASTWTGYFLLTAATSMAINALTPKPPIGTGANRGYQVTARGTALAHQVIYGKTQTGGAEVYISTSDWVNPIGTIPNRYLHKVIAFAGHEIEEFEEIYINDELFDSNSRYYGKIYIAERLGTSDQAAVTSSEVNNITLPTEWDATRKLSGIAYLYIAMEYDADLFPNGVPEIKAVIKGKKVYDPRTSTTAWSDNPALCIRDYLTSSYGLAEESANVDDDYVSTAANVCEYFNYPTLTGDPRFSLNGAFVTSITPADILNDLLTSMGGMIWYAQGKWRMKPAYYTSPVLDINEDDFRSAVNVSTRHSRRDNFNIVKGTWKGPDSFYQVTDYPQVPDAAATNPFVVADNGQESVVDLNLAFTNNVIQARRIARILLERNRQQLTIEASFGLRTFQVQVGDIVRVTNTRFGWTNKEFEVVKWTFGLQEGNDLQTQMTLREISESVFDDVDDGVVYEADNTTLLSPFDVPPVAIALTQEYRVINEHVTNVLVVNVTSTSPTRVDYVEVEFKKSTESTYSVLGTGDLGRFEIIDIETPLAGATDTIVYDVRARAINALGVKGTFTDAQKTVEADTTGPSAPATFEKQLSGGTLFFSWTASTDFDLSYYRLWHSSSTTATFTDGSPQVIINKVARPATSVAYPAISGTFFIEPYDKSGNEGTVTSVVVLPSELPELGTSQTDTENPSFAGSKTNVAVATGPDPDELRLSSFATAPSTGTYEFTGYLDTGSTRTVRVSTNLTSTRHHANASGGLVNWDEIPNNWDTWPNNWDDWSDEDQPYGDFSTTIYVAATNDDPAGSPTWGSWVIAAGELTGRAFKFKAELDSTSNNVSPSISVLEGIVEY